MFYKKERKQNTKYIIYLESIEEITDLKQPIECLITQKSIEELGYKKKFNFSKIKNKLIIWKNKIKALFKL